MDEAFSILAARLSLSDIIEYPIDVHPPLFYLVQRVWTGIYSGVDLARVPAAVAGILTIPVVMLTGYKRTERIVPVFSGMFVAVSTGHIYYSQDARMYTLLVLLLSLSSLCIVEVVVGRLDRHKHFAAAYVLASGLAVYTHFIALPYIFALNVAALMAAFTQRSLQSRLPMIAIANLVLLFAAAPWLYSLVTRGSDFPGLGEVSLKVLPWMIHNALGMSGFSGPAKLLGDSLLLLSTGLGAAVLWRRSPPLAIISVVTLVLYVVVMLLLNLIVPIFANRVFLPCLPFVALLFGMLTLSGAALRVRTCLAIVVLLLMTASSINEHAYRTKYEDVPAALDFARSRGLAGAPVLTCSFFTAGSVWAADPGIGNYVVSSSGVLRFDEHFNAAFKQSVPWLMKADAPDISRSLGGGYIVAGGLAGLVREQGNVILITAPCNGNDTELTYAHLKALGFHIRASTSFHGGKDGHALIQPGQTSVALLSRF